MAGVNSVITSYSIHYTKLYELHARFSLLYVDDLAAAVLAWIRSGTANNGVFTLDDGREGGYDWRDVAIIVGRVCRRRVRLLRVPAWALDIPAWLNRRASRQFVV